MEIVCRIVLENVKKLFVTENPRDVVNCVKESATFCNAMQRRIVCNIVAVTAIRSSAPLQHVCNLARVKTVQ